jgi:hypothetical protein
MSSHLIALHKYFFKLLQKKFSIKSNKIVDEERIIELITTKNHNFLLWNGKKMRWTLPLGKSQRHDKINPIIGKSLQVNPQIKKHLVFNLAIGNYQVNPAIKKH